MTKYLTVSKKARDLIEAQGKGAEKILAFMTLRELLGLDDDDAPSLLEMVLLVKHLKQVQIRQGKAQNPIVAQPNGMICTKKSIQKRIQSDKSVMTCLNTHVMLEKLKNTPADMSPENFCILLTKEIQKLLDSPEKELESTLEAISSTNSIIQVFAGGDRLLIYFTSIETAIESFLTSQIPPYDSSQRPPNQISYHLASGGRMWRKAETPVSARIFEEMWFSNQEVTVDLLNSRIHGSGRHSFPKNPDHGLPPMPASDYFASLEFWFNRRSYTDADLQTLIDIFVKYKVLDIMPQSEEANHAPLAQLSIQTLKFEELAAVTPPMSMYAEQVIQFLEAFLKHTQDYQKSLYPSGVPANIDSPLWSNQKPSQLTLVEGQFGAVDNDIFPQQTTSSSSHNTSSTTYPSGPPPDYTSRSGPPPDYTSRSGPGLYSQQSGRSSGTSSSLPPPYSPRP